MYLQLHWVTWCQIANSSRLNDAHRSSVLWSQEKSLQVAEDFPDGKYNQQVAECLRGKSEILASRRGCRPRRYRPPLHALPHGSLVNMNFLHFSLVCCEKVPLLHLVLFQRQTVLLDRGNSDSARVSSPRLPFDLVPVNTSPEADPHFGGIGLSKRAHQTL